MIEVCIFRHNIEIYCLPAMASSVVAISNTPSNYAAFATEHLHEIPTGEELRYTAPTGVVAGEVSMIRLESLLILNLQVINHNWPYDVPTEKATQNPEQKQEEFKYNRHHC